MDSDTPLSEKQMREILARAADRQRAAERSLAKPEAALTLGALREAASEAGMDAGHLDAAAYDVLLRRETAPAPSRLGLPLELTARRSIRAGVTDVQWERIVGELRTTFKKTGIATQYGAVREWVSSDERSNFPVHVRLEPEQGGTRITLRQDTGAQTEVLYGVGGSFSFMAVLLGALFAFGDFAPAVMLIPVLLLVLAMVSSGGAWLAYRAAGRRQEERFASMLDRIELVAGSG